MLMHGKVLTNYNLIRIGFSLASRCVFCKRDEEMMNHLFIHFEYLATIWQGIIAKLGVT